MKIVRQFVLPVIFFTISISAMEKNKIHAEIPKIKLGHWENVTQEKLYFTKDSTGTGLARDEQLGKIDVKGGLRLIGNKEPKFVYRPTSNLTIFDMGIRSKRSPYPRLIAILSYHPENNSITSRLLLRQANLSEKEISRDQLILPKNKINEIVVNINGSLEGAGLEKSRLNLTVNSSATMPKSIEKHMHKKNK